MNTAPPAPPEVAALEDAEVDRILAETLGREQRPLLTIRRKREERLHEAAVQWANYVLYEVTHDDRKVDVVVEVDEYHHHGPVVLQTETRFCSPRTPFLAKGLPKTITHREPRPRDQRWAARQLGFPTP